MAPGNDYNILTSWDCRKKYHFSSSNVTILVSDLKGYFLTQYEEIIKVYNVGEGSSSFTY